MKSNIQNNRGLILSVLACLLLLALLLARTIFPELIWVSVFFGVLLVADLAALIKENRRALTSRQAAYGLNSVVTILLVLGILGVLNFLAVRYPFKTDLTKNKVNTLSDQTVKLVKGLQRPVKAAIFVKMPQKEQYRPLLDNYRALNPKFEVEFVDPDREPTRAKQAGVKKYGTLLLTVGTRDTKIEEPTEEKLTNALIKLTKDKSPQFCAITGHGEKSFSSSDAEGYESVRKALGNQAYEMKDIALAQEGKVPDTCDAIAIMGPTKAFFPQEVKALRDYLDNGGRALIALDVNLQGGEYSPEIVAILETWGIKPEVAVVIDPLSKMLGVDASVPIVATFSKENPITKDFQANCYFPFARPVPAIAKAPEGITVQWMGQTTPKSWSEGNLKQLSSGEARFDNDSDRPGPVVVATSAQGKQKDSKASKNTRLVVFGSSHFATNNYARFGGNMDLFLNSASWLMEDESLISIRAKEEGPGKVELSQKSGLFIFWLTVVIIPLLVSIAGVVIWVLRKRL